MSPCASVAWSCWWGLHHDAEGVVYEAGPAVELGSPANRVGAQARVAWEFPSRRLWIGLGAEGNVFLAQRELGIPGPGASSAWTVPLSLGVRVGQAAVGASYEPILYVDSHGTSQATGAVTLFAHGPGASWHYRFENDILGGLGDDEFRTAGSETYLRFRLRGHTVAVGGELALWTATTRGLDPLEWGEVYDLQGQVGYGYSHGVLCLGVAFDAWAACVGVDAERVRDTFQNRLVHRAIDDGSLPMIDRPDALYVRLGVNPSRFSF